MIYFLCDEVTNAAIRFFFRLLTGDYYRITGGKSRVIRQPKVGTYPKESDNIQVSELPLCL
ncbi:MAG: hypothetical protein C0523_06190 [Cytophaga sp.]|nr:hypothetical protein [Cytophaga sp.]